MKNAMSWAVSLLLILGLQVSLAALQHQSASAFMSRPQTQRQVNSPTPQITPRSPALRLEIREISLRSKNRLIVQDNFKRSGKFQALLNTEPGVDTVGPRVADYHVRYGNLATAGFRNGALLVNESTLVPLRSTATAPANAGLATLTDSPAEARIFTDAFGSSFGALFSIPVSSQGVTKAFADDRTFQGNSTFSGKQMFGNLVFSAQVHAPALKGYETFTLGITDVGARRPAGKMSLRRDRITLEFVSMKEGQWPWQEIVLDQVDLTALRGISDVQLTFMVDANGQMSGLANVSSRGGRRQFKLTGADPKFYLNPNYDKYAASIFVETLPKPQIAEIRPNQLTKSELRGETIVLQLLGIGFGKDTSVELIPKNQKAGVILARNVKVEPHNSKLSATIPTSRLRGNSYSLRVKTAGQVAIMQDAVTVK